MTQFADIFANRPLLADGAMGTVLYSRGVFINRCYDELNLSDPGLILSVHEEYLQAGAEILETNTFNATAVSHVTGGVVTDISISSAGFGYTNTPAIRIAAPPAAAVAPTVWPVMRVDSRTLAPYDNYQVQFKPELGGAWGNWDGGLFTSAGGTNSQYLFITNGPGLFRLQYVP